MPVSAKICGLSTPDTLAAAITGGASHVGFMLYSPSPRNVSLGRLAELANQVPERVKRVGVFVDPEEELLERAVPHVDAIQLHNTTAARSAAIRARFGREVWATVPVKARGDLDAARSYNGAADCILYDAKTPEGATRPGGMGLRFDWALLDGFRHPLPWALAGGLDSDNVAEAIRMTGALLVDVSSGVESAPGVKDAGEIARFLRVVANL